MNGPCAKSAGRIFDWNYFEDFLKIIPAHKLSGRFLWKNFARGNSTPASFPEELSPGVSWDAGRPGQRFLRPSTVTGGTEKSTMALPPTKVSAIPENTEIPYQKIGRRFLLPNSKGAAFAIVGSSPQDYRKNSFHDILHLRPKAC